MSNQEFEILKSRIQGLSAKVDAVTILASNQEQRSFQDNNNLNRFNEAGLTNPLEQDIDANNFDIENIKDFSAKNGKFITLKVGDNVITGEGGGSSGILIEDNGAVTEVSSGSGAQAITKLDFDGNVTVGRPRADGSDFKQTVTIPFPQMSFSGLSDTPSSLEADKFVKVNSAGNALEFVASTDPPTVANPTAAASGSEKPGLGSNIKGLINHGCHVNWTQSGDNIYGIGTEMHLGGSSLVGLPSNDRDEYKQALECVSISNNGKFIAIGAPNASQQSGNDDGMVFLYECVNGHWVLLATCGQVQYLAQDDTAGHNSGARFGFSVAINGDADRSSTKTIILAVGSINQSNSSKGGVHVFRLYDQEYGADGRPGAILVADDDDFPNSTGLGDSNIAIGQNFGDRLGLSVALDGSGRVLAVGSAAGAGVRIYRRRDKNLVGSATYAGGAVDDDPDPTATAKWFHYQNIGVGNVPDVGISDDFGFSVALSNNGQYLAATSIKDSPGSTRGDERGFIRVHHINYTVAGDGTASTSGVVAGSSTPHTLHPTNASQDVLQGEVNDRLGYSVKISDDGYRIVVGSVDQEYVKVFSTTGDNVDWAQLGNTIKPTLLDTSARGGSAATVDAQNSTSPITPLVNFDTTNTFGESIGMNKTGDIIIVGASKSTQPYDHQGLVRVFSLDNDSGTNLLKWNQLGQTILGTQSKFQTTHLGSRLGMCVSMNAEGNIFGVSAPGDGDPRYKIYTNPVADSGFEGQPELFNQHNTGAVKIFHLTSSLPAIDIRRLATFLDHFKT